MHALHASACLPVFCGGHRRITLAHTHRNIRAAADPECALDLAVAFAQRREPALPQPHHVITQVTCAAKPCTSDIHLRFYAHLCAQFEKSTCAQLEDQANRGRQDAYSAQADDVGVGDLSQPLGFFEKVRHRCLLDRRAVPAPPAPDVELRVRADIIVHARINM